MSAVTYYVQECPTCGRSLEVRIEYLGKRVRCRHCGAKFVAIDGSYSGLDASLTESTILQRADELINTASRSGIGLDGSSEVAKQP